MLPTSAGVEPVTSWSPVGRRIQLSPRSRSQVIPETFLNWYELAVLSLRKKTGHSRLCIHVMWLVDMDPDKMLFQLKSMVIFSYFCIKNICCGYSLVPPLGISNEYLQHMFSCRNKKNVYLIPVFSGVMAPSQYNLFGAVALSQYNLSGAVAQSQYIFVLSSGTESV